MPIYSKNIIKNKICQVKKINNKQILLNKLLKETNNEIENEITDSLKDNEFIVFRKISSPEVFVEYPENTTLEEIKNNVIDTLINLKDQYDIEIIKILIEKINSKGFISDTNAVLRNNIKEITGKSIDDNIILNYLEKIKSLFPYGIGCRNEKEFKDYQIKKMDNSELLLDVNNWLSAGLNKKNYKSLLKKYRENDVKKGINICSNLAKYPTIFLKKDVKNDRISIDFFVKINYQGVLEVRTREIEIPLLKPFKDELVPKNCDPKYKEYLLNKFNFAKNLCDNLKKRNEYLKKLIENIVDIQREFFITGNVESLKPMTYSLIQKKIGMSISTISRIVSSKNVQTDFGVFLLKDIFWRSINGNKNVSIVSVYFKIKNIIEKNVDISDSQIIKILKKENININRRTLTNYRSKIGIKNSFFRKIFM